MCLLCIIILLIILTLPAHFKGFTESSNTCVHLDEKNILTAANIKKIFETCDCIFYPGSQKYVDALFVQHVKHESVYL